MKNRLKTEISKVEEKEKRYMRIYEIILFVIGVFFIIYSFLMNTKNVQSAILFKVIPFFCGVYCAIYACLNSGFIKIG